MLKSIDIYGIGGIREAHLSFSGKFTVITGESGAGKSSLVRAMEFITGSRARENNIHTLEEKCEVTALLSSQTCDTEIKRVFSRSGKGKIYIQNHAASLSELTNVIDGNVAVHSQFAQLALLDASHQLELVDSCGGETLKATAHRLEDVFYQTLKTEKEVVAIKKRRSECEKLYDNAPDIIRHIKALALTPESEQEWECQLNELDKREKRIRLLRIISNELDSENGVSGVLEKIIGRIGQDEQNAAIGQSAETALDAVQNLSSIVACAVKNELSISEIESEREAVEKKLGVLRKIKRILHVQTPNEIMNYVARAESELAWLKASREELDALEKKAQNLRQELKNIAVDLRMQRKQAAESLAENVNKHLHEMAMDYAEFGAEIVPQDKIGANGAESVVFTLAMPDALPIDKNASGGELSRILIAVQLSVSDDKLPETLVFDEVEAGLGGKTALLAGYKLKSLSQRCRTILITHQATIAAMADTHYVVRRRAEDTVIEEISGEAREKEIARMLSGDENSSEAIEHARALLKQQ